MKIFNRVLAKYARATQQDKKAAHSFSSDHCCYFEDEGSHKKSKPISVSVYCLLCFGTTGKMLSTASDVGLGCGSCSRQNRRESQCKPQAVNPSTTNPDL